MRSYIWFAIGAAAGFLAAALALKKRYDKKLEARVIEIKKTNDLMAGRERIKVTKNDEGEVDVEPDTAIGSSEPEDPQGDFDISEYAASDDKPVPEYPFAITQTEFEEDEEYTKVNVIYYSGSEQAIASATGEEIDREDLGAVYGLLSEDAFLESEDGFVYIRNPRLSTDFAVDLYPTSVEEFE